MRSFTLSKYLLRAHVGPFVFSLVTIVLIFLLDLLFRQLNRIMSKGLPWQIVLEFFVLNLAWIVATAVPMAVLTATLMAFGRMAADNELTAVQAGGISLLKLVRPVFFAAGLLALGLFWFNDNILPVCNYRVRHLAAEIAVHKPGIKLEPGVWFKEFPNYALLAETLQDSGGVTKASELLIDDNSRVEVRRTISARRGFIEPRPQAGKFLLTLFEGEIQEIDHQKDAEFRRLVFTKHLIAIAAQELFPQHNPEALRNDREKSTQDMWQEIQTTQAAQRVRLEQLEQIAARFSQTHPLVQQKRFDYANAEQFIQSLLVEIHKKYAIASACLVFVLIGAPLGAWARRRGLATSVGLSLGFFLLYWVFLIGGEALADRQVLSPVWSMWSANLITGTLGLVLLGHVSTGTQIVPTLRFFNKQRWANWWAEVKQQVERMLESYLAPQRQPSSPALKPETWVEFDITEPDFVFKMGLARALLPATAARAALSPDRIPRVLSILQRIVARAELEFAFFCDRSGTLMAQYQGAYHHALSEEHVTRITTAAATQMTTSEKIARLLGEDQPFHACFEEGELRRFWLQRVDHNYILIAVAKHQVSPGLVRIYLQRAVTSLEEVLKSHLR